MNESEIQALKMDIEKTKQRMEKLVIELHFLRSKAEMGGGSNVEVRGSLVNIIDNLIKEIQESYNVFVEDTTVR